MWKAVTIGFILVTSGIAGKSQRHVATRDMGVDHGGRLNLDSDQDFRLIGICKLVGRFCSVSKPRPSMFRAPQNRKSP